VVARSKGFRYWPLLLPVLVVRELSFGLGVVRGRLGRGPGRKAGGRR